MTDDLPTISGIRDLLQNRLSTTVLQALDTADKQATRAGSSTVETEHLLFGLIADETSEAFAIVESLDPSFVISRSFFGSVARSSNLPAQTPRLADSSLDALNLAGSRVDKDARWCIESGDLLWGLWAVGRGVAAGYLESVGYVGNGKTTGPGTGAADLQEYNVLAAHGLLKAIGIRVSSEDPMFRAVMDSLGVAVKGKRSISVIVHMASAFLRFGASIVMTPLSSAEDADALVSWDTLFNLGLLAFALGFAFATAVGMKWYDALAWSAVTGSIYTTLAGLPVAAAVASVGLTTRLSSLFLKGHPVVVDWLTWLPVPWLVVSTVALSAAASSALAADALRLGDEVWYVQLMPLPTAAVVWFTLAILTPLLMQAAVSSMPGDQPRSLEAATKNAYRVGKSVLGDPTSELLFRCLRSARQLILRTPWSSRSSNAGKGTVLEGGNSGRMEFQSEVQKACFGRVANWMTELFGEQAVAVEGSPSLMIRSGSAVASITVLDWPEANDSLINVSAWVVRDIAPTLDLTLFLLKANSGFAFGAFSLDSENDISFKHSISGSVANKDQLRIAVLAVLQTADEYDEQITSSWGGKRAVD